MNSNEMWKSLKTAAPKPDLSGRVETRRRTVRRHVIIHVAGSLALLAALTFAADRRSRVANAPVELAAETPVTESQDWEVEAAEVLYSAEPDLEVILADELAEVGLAETDEQSFRPTNIVGATLVVALT